MSIVLGLAIGKYLLAGQESYPGVVGERILLLPSKLCRIFRLPTPNGVNLAYVLL